MQRGISSSARLSRLPALTHATLEIDGNGSQALSANGGSSDSVRIGCFCGALLQVLLKPFLRIKLLAADGAFIRLSRFMFLCHFYSPPFRTIVSKADLGHLTP